MLNLFHLGGKIDIRLFANATLTNVNHGAFVARAPEPRRQVQRHRSHRLPAGLQGGREGPAAAEEGLRQEAHLHCGTLCYHRSQQCHHMERYPPQDQHQRGATIVSMSYLLKCHLLRGNCGLKEASSPLFCKVWTRDCLVITSGTKVAFVTIL